MRFLVLLLPLVVLTAPLACTAGPDAEAAPDAWPQFRFDAAHTGFNRFERTLSPANVGSLVQKWHAIAGSSGLGGGVQSEPTVKGGVVYVNSQHDTLYAFAASDGSSLWTGETGGYGAGSAVIGRLAYVGTVGGVQAYPLSCTSTCTPYWTGDAGITVNPSVTLDRGVVYVGAYSGHLDALDERTGALLWSGEVNRFDPIFGSPSVAGGRVYVPGDLGVYCFPTGCTTRCQPLWTARTQFGMEQSPAVAMGVVYAIDDQGTLYALDPTSGERLWIAHTGALSRSPAVDANAIYASASDGRLWAFPIGCSGTCEPLWKVSTGLSLYAPVVANGVVYVGALNSVYTLPGAVLAFDAATGALLWSQQTDGAVESSPTVVGGRVYVATITGNVYAYGLP